MGRKETRGYAYIKTYRHNMKRIAVERSIKNTNEHRKSYAFGSRIININGNKDWIYKWIFQARSGRRRHKKWSHIHWIEDGICHILQ